MGNIYVRSTTGSDTNDGLSWATAKATLAGAAAIDVAGDTIYVSQAHNETLPSANTTLAFAGNYSNPTKIVCCSDSSGEPPTVSASSATINLSAGYNLYLTGVIICEGIKFHNNNAGGSAFYVNANQSFVTLRTCTLDYGFVSGGTTATNETAIKLENCVLNMGTLSSSSCLQPTASNIKVKGGYSSTLNTQGSFIVSAGECNCEVVDFDFSNFSTSFFPVYSTEGGGEYKFVNCKLPTGWNASILKGSIINPKCKATMFNCGGIVYRCEMSSGVISFDSSIFRTNGAIEDTTPFSWKFVTNANANEHINQLISEVIIIPNETVGSLTLKCHFTCANLLDDSQIWAEISYPNFGSLVTKRASIVTTPTQHPVSSGITWTGGLVNLQSLSVTISPTAAGNIYIRLFVAKASETVYVDPAIDVT